MRKGEGVDMPGAERERRARQLRLVLQCAGPGSVTGSRSTQCRREGRPHGGYKGLSSKYPLSRLGFDKKEFIEEVKNSVNAQYREEQKCRSNSPLWLPAANKEKNHTGEQPLILQNFLAPNKQEQIDGVLPAPNPVGKRKSKSAVMYHDDPDYFCRGNSTHQYLTATEMPGQSERLVDLTLGRPTRTSLLRVRQRTKSAPGVRAIVEIKTHLHRQQKLAAKTEERYKSVDVPQDLLPVTEDHETVHQFLIGARYNRLYHYDAKCLNKLGLFVSRQDPLRCFKVNVPPKEKQAVTNLRSSASTLTLTESCESFGSESNLSELTALSQGPPDPKSAWANTGQEDHMKGPQQSATPAPSPSTANHSRETFSPKHNPGWKTKPRLKLIDGKTLTAHGKQESGHECCIMCRSEEHGKHYQRFAPGSHFARVKGSGKDDEDRDWNHNTDHMLVQQYQLRILGIKYGMKSGPRASPRNNLFYATKKSDMTELPTIKQTKNLKAINRNTSSDNTMAAPVETQAALPERSSSNSSKVSVRISTHSKPDEDTEAIYPGDIPRTDAAGENSKDANKEGGNTRVSGETKHEESGKEGKDILMSEERVAEREEAVAHAISGRDTSEQEDGKVSRNDETYIDYGPGITQDLLADDAKDNNLSQNVTEDSELKDSSDFLNDAEENDAQLEESQDVEETNRAAAGDEQQPDDDSLDPQQA